MSASPQAGQLPRGSSLLSNRLKEAGRALLAPLVRLAQRLGITPNGVTVIGFVVVAVAAGMVHGPAVALELLDPALQRGDLGAIGG